MNNEALAATQDIWSTRLLIVAALAGVVAALAAFASSWLAGQASDYYRRAGQTSVAHAHEAAMLAAKDASDANLQAARANERTARLKLEAETLRSRLQSAEHAVSGRRLDQHTRERLITRLAGLPPFSIIVDSPEFDTEAATLAFDLQQAFKNAGASSPKEFGLPACSSAGSENQATLYAPTLVEPLPIPHLKAVPPESDPIYAALKDAGFNLGVCASVMHGTNQVTPDYYALRIEHRGPTYLTRR